MDMIFGLSASQSPQTCCKLQVPNNPVYRCNLSNHYTAFRWHNHSHWHSTSCSPERNCIPPPAALKETGGKHEI